METTGRTAKWDDDLTCHQKQLVKDHSTILNFSSNETIIKQGISAQSIMYLEEGMAKLSIQQKDRLTTFKLIPKESFIGLMCSFVNRSFDFTAVAIVPCRVRLIDRNIFEELIRNNGDFAVKLVEQISQSTNKIVHDLVEIGRKNVDGALSTILLEMARIFRSDTFIMPFSRIELADTIGYSKESVINSLSSLQRNGILSISAKKVTILDRKRLELISRTG